MTVSERQHDCDGSGIDQAEPEDRIVCRHPQKCRAGANLDCDACLFHPGFHQVPVEADEKHTADSAAIAVKRVRNTRLNGVAAREPASDATDQYPADGFIVKVNGTAVVSFITN